MLSPSDLSLDIDLGHTPAPAVDSPLPPLLNPGEPSALQAWTELPHARPHSSCTGGTRQRRHGPGPQELRPTEEDKPVIKTQTRSDCLQADACATEAQKLRGSGIPPSALSSSRSSVMSSSPKFQLPPVC